MASNSDLFNKLFGGRGQSEDKPKGPLFGGAGKPDEPPQVRSAFGGPGRAAPDPEPGPGRTGAARPDAAPSRPLGPGPGRTAEPDPDRTRGRADGGQDAPPPQEPVSPVRGPAPSLQGYRTASSRSAGGAAEAPPAGQFSPSRTAADLHGERPAATGGPGRHMEPEEAPQAPQRTEPSHPRVSAPEEPPPRPGGQRPPGARVPDPDDDLDYGRQVPTLGRSVKPTRSRGKVEMDSAGSLDVDTHLDYTMEDLFRLVVDEKGSDLHMSIAAPPVVRIHGKMVRTKLPVLNKENMRHLLYSIMNDDQRNKLEQNWELDFSLQVSGLCRFRCNVFFQKDGLSGVFRVIPSRTPTLQELNMPSIIMDIARKHKGMVLVTGPTGNGKSTTLAAMVNLINCERPEHIITIEDPIEFTHDHKMCIINQREVGQNTKSFSAALRSALREDPDIILVGELRDLETIQMALTAAETGHLVFGTLHTSSAYKTIDRVIDVFPPHQQEQIRVQLSETLQAVVAQQLIPVADGTGRVCAQEILINSPAIANLIREGKTYQIFSVLQTSKQQGMQTMDQSLKDLLKHRKITYDEAYKRATDKKSFERG